MGTKRTLRKMERAQSGLENAGQVTTNEQDPTFTLGTWRVNYLVLTPKAQIFPARSGIAS